ncbi:Bug family tripartite tricarboxylate transporter substrate binding protein [Comamonas serinivorans]|nr:tripartite tricarboxylate transporter substrate binding protein [Comamonas serinivorans]
MHHPDRRRSLHVLTRLGAACLAGPLAAQAQPTQPPARLPSASAAAHFPQRALRLFNPFPVGGGPDGVSRLIAQKLGAAYQVPVVVDNRPGANGFLAIEAFRAASAPARDGHELIVLDLVHLAAYPWLFKRLPYDPERDFTPLLPLFRTHFFIAVGRHSPHHTLADLLAEAQRARLTYGSWAVGSPAHLGAAMLAEQTGTRMDHIVYKETAQLYADVANGTLSFALGTLATMRALVDGDRLRLLAVCASQRLGAHPQVPTVAEAGGPAGFTVAGINLLAGPAGLPPAVADQLWRDVGRSLQGPDVDAKFNAFGYEPFAMPRAELPAYLQAQRLTHQRLVRAANITPL